MSTLSPPISKERNNFHHHPTICAQKMSESVDETDLKQIIQCAIYERLSDGTSFEGLAKKYNLAVATVNRYYNKWMLNAPDSQPQHPNDIRISIPKKGRPTLFTSEQEKLIKEAVIYYANNLTPLSRQSLIDLAEVMLETNEIEPVQDCEQKLTKGWVEGFLHRHPELKLLSIQTVDAERSAACTAHNIAEHIARVKSAVHRYNIRSPLNIINADESGVSFKNLNGRSRRYAIGPRASKIVHTGAKMPGTLDHVTVMSVVSGIGRSYKPVIVFPGRQMHYRLVNGDHQTLLDWLPPCYFFQRDVAGVDSSIFFAWAKEFVEETSTLRQNGRYLLLILDSFAAHTRYRTLKYLVENRVLVIGFPSHLSHILQPLDVSVFSSFKSKVRGHMHKLTRVKKNLDAFDIANMLSLSIQESHTIKNIRSGFHRSGAWNQTQWCPSVSSLQSTLGLYGAATDDSYPASDLARLCNSFENSSRSLLYTVNLDVSEKGTIRVNSTSGVHLTSQAALDALLQKETKTREKKKAEEEIRRRNESLSLFIAYEVDNEPKNVDSTAELRHLEALRPRREIMRERLLKSRKQRRLKAAAALLI